MLKVIERDSGWKHFQNRSDSRLLLAFIDRYAALGWLPPNDDRAVAILRSFGVTAHAMAGHDWCYEILVAGARGDREPKLTVFFHVDTDSNMIRLVAVEQMRFVQRRRDTVLRRVGDRMAKLIQMLNWLKQRSN